MSTSIIRADFFQPNTLTIRRPNEADIPGVAAVFSEMQSHYDRPVPAELAREAAALACRPVTSTFDPRVLIAIDDDIIIGTAVLNVSFPAFELSKSLYIRDLYVRARARRQGIGSALVKAAIRLAVEEGFSALDWTTETANLSARKMYEACGARLLHRSYYRLTKEDLADPTC